MNTTLKTLIDSVLGQNGSPSSNGEVKYYCPYCSHRKQKLQINLNENNEGAFGRYNCWVCNAKGNLITLFKKQKASPDQLSKLQGIILRITGKSLSIDKTGIKQQDTAIYLPEYFIPLSKGGNSPEYKNVLHYVRNKRHFNMIDIMRYNIGYCESGEYIKKVIIPSYDDEGDLNYFVGRSYYDVDYGKHKNPNISKNFIGWDLYINWSECIHICEGVFDAIAIKRNAIPLYGKIILTALKIKIIEKQPPAIYVILDEDAQREAIKICEEFMNSGITVFFVQLPKGEDPASLGYKTISDIISKTAELTLHDIIRFKLKM